MRASATFALAAALALPLGALAGEPPTIDPGHIPDPVVLMPDGPAAGAVFLLSTASGWTDTEADLAARLQRSGAAVVGIDLPAYLAALDAEGQDCLYLVADFERLSHVLERASGATTFHAPLLAGAGAGGALALDILSQTPADTLGGVIVANPEAGAGLRTALCTRAAREGPRYALPAGAQPAPLTVVLGADAPSEAAARADALQAAGVTLTRAQSDLAGQAALGDALASEIAAAAVAGDAPAIVELPATPTRDTVAIMISGDGGWRDLDKTVAGLLQAAGVPSVGLDSLRWFWTARTPEETGKELARLVDVYTERWGVRRVLLAGYSFGASVLPAAYRAMPEEARAKVVEVALLGPGQNADWQITVSGWLGGTSSGAPGTDAAAVPPALLQCFYGAKETDSACPALAGSGAELVRTGGGHHFDGDYAALAARILDGLDRRAAAGQ